MMDISDGLSADLYRLCIASRVGARVNEHSVPTVKLSAAQSRSLKNLNFDPMELALHGGDDYGLLFTVPRKLAVRMPRAPGFRDISQIGEIVSGSSILLVNADGRTRRLKPRGWDSFRRQSSKRSR
jgi:thiamine-monophosphate kinase